MRNVSLLICLLWTSAGSAQQVMAVSGAELTGGTYSLTYTIGETVVSSLSSPALTVTQGFHQPDMLFSGIQQQLPFSSVKVYPNPVQTSTTIRIISENKLTYQLDITDLAGRRLERIFYGAIEPGGQNFEWKPALPAGTYILRLSSGNQSEAQLITVLK